MAVMYTTYAVLKITPEKKNKKKTKKKEKKKKEKKNPVQACIFSGFIFKTA